MVDAKQVARPPCKTDRRVGINSKASIFVLITIARLQESTCASPLDHCGNFHRQAAPILTQAIDVGAKKACASSPVFAIPPFRSETQRLVAYEDFGSIRVQTVGWHRQSSAYDQVRTKALIVAHSFPTD
jgi:hypothetical protein